MSALRSPAGKYGNFANEVTLTLVSARRKEYLLPVQKEIIRKESSVNMNRKRSSLSRRSRKDYTPSDPVQCSEVIQANGHVHKRWARRPDPKEGLLIRDMNSGLVFQVDTGCTSSSTSFIGEDIGTVTERESTGAEPGVSGININRYGARDMKIKWDGVQDHPWKFDIRDVHPTIGVDFLAFHSITLDLVNMTIRSRGYTTPASLETPPATPAFSPDLEERPKIKCDHRKLLLSQLPAPYCVLDTGATASVVSTQVLKRIPRDCELMEDPRFIDYGGNLVRAYDKPLKASLAIHAGLKFIARNFEFTIIESKSPTCLIGMDVISKLFSEIHFPERTLKVRGHDATVQLSDLTIKEFIKK